MYNDDVIIHIIHVQTLVHVDMYQDAWECTQIAPCVHACTCTCTCQAYDIYVHNHTVIWPYS